MNTSLDIAKQIDSLTLSPDHDLIICDVDEVVVHFLRALEVHLDDNGCWLDAVSFALNGNIRRHVDNEPIPAYEVGALLHEFFDKYTGRLEPIDGAIEGLTSLSQDAQLIFLTNLPDSFAAARKANLNAHGFANPILVNSGPKGPAVKLLAEKTNQRSVFIDDTPGNVNSVVEEAPDVDIVHFINDPRFAKLLPPMEGVSLRTSDWRETTDHLFELFDRNGT